MSVKDSLESKLEDLQNHYTRWKGIQPTSEAEERQKEKNLAGLVIDIDKVQALILSSNG